MDMEPSIGEAQMGAIEYSGCGFQCILGAGLATDGNRIEIPASTEI